MGTTNSAFRANAAFSLYGVLSEYDNSQSSSLKKKSKCSELTYINSFFTTTGAGALSDIVGTIQTNDVAYTTSECTMEKDSYGDYKSTTMGCDEKAYFTFARFKGKYCEGPNFDQNIMILGNYTEAMMEDLDCLQIWDYDTNVNNNNNNNRHLRNYGYNNKRYGYGSMAEQILKVSQVCDLSLYPYDCPDPYGIKSMYDVNLLRAQVGLAPENLVNPDKPYVAWTWLMFILGIVMVGLTIYIAPASTKAKAAKYCLGCLVTSKRRSNQEEADSKQGGGSPVKIKSRLPSVKRMTKSPPLSENEMASHIHHEYYEPKEAASPAHDKRVPERVSSLFRQRRDKETNDEGNSDIQGKSAAPKKLSERLASFFRQRSEDEIDDDEGFDEGPTTMKKFSPPKSARKKTAGILT